MEAEIKSNEPDPSMWRFLTIWTGQLVSLIGSGLTSFALSVWVYQQTGSATQLAFVNLFFYVGIVVMSPLAGSLVDRWNKRWAMIVSDSGAALSTLFIVILLIGGWLQTWHIYLSVAINAAFQALQWPAYTTAIALLVPKEQLGRANGMVQLGRGISQTAAPVIAGALVPIIQLQGVILIDFITFLVGVLTLLMITIPSITETAVSQPESPDAPEANKPSQGWRYIQQRPGLIGLLTFMSLVGLIYGMAQILFMPLVLEFSSETTLGTIMSIGSIGMFMGGALMSILGGPRQRIYGVLGPGILLGIALMLIGLRPNTVLVTGGMFIALMTVPIISGSDEAIWQSKVSLTVQGRVFAAKNAITTAVLPIAALIAGPMAEFVFEPLLTADGALSQTIGRVIGTGTGRGIGLLFIVLGIIVTFIAGAGLFYPRLRYIENELPDILPDKQPLPTKQDKQTVEGYTQ